jgi:hypothetical protein
MLYLPPACVYKCTCIIHTHIHTHEQGYGERAQVQRDPHFDETLEKVKRALAKMKEDCS